MLAHAKDRTVQIDVLPAGEFGVEPGTHLKQGGDPTLDADLAGRRGCHPRKDLQQGTLAGPISTDHADRVSGADGEIYISQTIHNIS